MAFLLALVVPRRVPRTSEPKAWSPKAPEGAPKAPPSRGPPAKAVPRPAAQRWARGSGQSTLEDSGKCLQHAEIRWCSHHVQAPGSASAHGGVPARAPCPGRLPPGRTAGPAEERGARAAVRRAHARALEAVQQRLALVRRLRGQEQYSLVSQVVWCVFADVRVPVILSRLEETGRAMNATRVHTKTLPIRRGSSIG